MQDDCDEKQAAQGGFLSAVGLGSRRLQNIVDQIADCHCQCRLNLDLLDSMAGTTGLEPATSAVTANQKPVTYWNQGERMAPFSALRNDWEPL